MTVEQPSNTIDLPRLIDCADYIINRAGRIIAQINSQPFGDSGGYLAVHEIASNSVELVLRLGYFNIEKAAKRIEFSMEKASRLHQRISAGEHDFTSYETRNPEQNMWGGAIRGNTMIFSFSGLPELWDEAAMLVLAIRLGYLVEEEVLKLISDDRNPHLRPLLGHTTKWQWP